MYEISAYGVSAEMVGFEEMETTKKGNTMQLLGMILVSLIIQVLSLAKSSIVASNFGAGVELDAFHFNNSIATFIVSFIAGGVTTVVLPEYVRHGKREGVDSFLTGLFFAVTILFIGLYVFRIPIVGFISGKTGDFLTYSDRIMGLTIIAQSITTVISVTAAHYQAKNSFVIPKLIALCTSALSLLVMFCLKGFTIDQYVGLICFAGIVQLIIDVVIAIKKGFRFSLRLNWLNNDSVRLFKVFVPIMISTGVYKIHGLVDTAITSGLAAGSLTILSYSNQIVTAATSLIIGNLLLFAYPKIVKAASQTAGAGIRVTREYGAVFHLVVGCLVVVFFAIGEEAIMILFGHGRFDFDAVRQTFICSMIYLFGQQCNIVRDLIYRFYYAEKDTVTTLRNSIMISFLNIILSLILVRVWQLYGVVLGTVISSACSMLSIERSMQKKYDAIGEIKGIRKDFLRTALSVSLSCVLLWCIKKWIALGSIWCSVLIYGMFSLVVYGFCILALHKGVMKQVMVHYRKNGNR